MWGCRNRRWLPSNSGGRNRCDVVVPGEESAGIVTTAVSLPLSLFGCAKGCRVVLLLLKCLHE